MKLKRLFISFLILAVFLVPFQAFAEDPALVSAAPYPYTDEDVLIRGKLYYSYLNQFFNNIVQSYQNAAEVTLTGAIGFSDTDYARQADFDAKVKQGKIHGPTLYIEYSVTDANKDSKVYYASDLLPVGGHIIGGLSQNNYATAQADFTGSNSGVEVLGNNFVKDSLNYKVRINIQDYIASGYATTKTQLAAIRAEKIASIVETPERYYPSLEKLLMTRGSNTETNEVIICVKGSFTDDELAQINYTDDSKIQYWMDYYTTNLKNQRLRVKKAYSILGDLTVIGNAGEYNKMSLIANGRDPDYTEIAPGMYRNAAGWTVFRVDLNDYSAKGYVY